MKFGARALLPSRISGQIALLILLSLLVFHAIVTVGIFWGREQFQPPGPPGRGRDLVTVVQFLAAMPRAERPRIMSYMADAFPNLRVAPAVALPDARPDAAPDSRLGFLRRYLGAGFQVLPADDAAGAAGGEIWAVRLPDGDIVSVTTTAERPPPSLGGPLLATALFIVVSISVLALWAARSLTTPLTRFARAAESFSPDGDIALVPEHGPAEIRAAARALNQMRSRIKTLVEDRIRMLAAMGHDLRTPITRMRLRSEFIADESLRKQMLLDLDQMRSMIDAALSYLRDGKAQEKKTAIDLATLLQTVCDQFGDMGYETSYIGPDHLTLCAQPDGLQRAVGNLVDNAVRYGGKALLRLTVMPDIVRIDVEDEGPGIADADKALMQEPFVRGNAARNMNDAHGFGLGLTIARIVAQAHHGTLSLHDRQPSGLIARITLARDHSMAD
ncbi:MAG: HAMP domain-containing protein [Pseudorhodoplanes sp.]|nr:MAG: HAMP domain-containing protein [Pseudorhodoplanes sp.]